MLAEVARVLEPSGLLYIAVPDSTTFSDRVYRWVYHGGGHVNPFPSPGALDQQVRRYVPLPLAGCRELRTSFGFLCRYHFPTRPHRRMWLFCNGHHRAIVTLAYFARLLDHLLGTRLSVYGWAMYYGDTPVSPEVWSNVCVHCGAAHPAETLSASRLFGPVRSYNCPACGAFNLFTRDSSSA